MDDLFTFAEPEEKEEVNAFWKVLIVDDDESIHLISTASLKEMIIDDKRLELFHAYNVQEAKDILDANDDMAMAFVDVVMETPIAGLDLVNYIRTEMKNENIRLIIRTGQPNDAPAKHVIDNYDINDYKEKTELTMERLYITVRSSIRQYHHIISLHEKYEEFYTQMMTDSLTQLPNRTKLNERLDQNGKMNLVLLNIRDFSGINRKEGFAKGDVLLKEMANVLKELYTPDMELFHLEADHFVLLSRNEISKSDLEQMQKQVQDHIRTVMQLEIELSIQIGAVLHEDGNMIRKAEYALHEVKNAGRSIKVFSDL